MSQPTEPITQQECRQRLAEAVFRDKASSTHVAISPADCAQWITAALSLAALLAGLNGERNLEFTGRATRLLMDTAGRTPGG